QRRAVTRTISQTHVLVVLKQENGELQEDILPRGVAEDDWPLEEARGRRHPSAPVPGTLVQMPSSDVSG
ncbi:MAG TPA: hypothetical protein VLZ77_16075, partial [Acidimicrobiales bacterium]|nr:hypothetical protein [Acidimicrobiales bacterium]